MHTRLLHPRAAAALTAALLLTASVIPVFADENDDSGTTTTTTTTASSSRPYIYSNNNAIILMDAGAQSPKAAPGEVVEIALPLAVNQEYLPTERFLLRNITIEPIIPTSQSDIDEWPFDLINASDIRHLSDMSFNSTANVFYEYRISHLATKGVYPVRFEVNATVWRDDEFNSTTITEDVSFEVGVYVTVTDDGNESGVVSEIAPLTVAGTEDGQGSLESPVGSPGETVDLFIPITNKGGKLTNITVTPVVTSDLNTFPFVAEQINYGRDLADMKSGDTVTLDYTFQISPFAPEGNKAITFLATYEENGVYGECTFTSYIYVENGYEDIQDTAPVVTVSGYQLFVDGQRVEQLNAGEDATLELTLLNNAMYENVYKVTSTIAFQDTEALMLTSGSSNTAYVSQIGPGESVVLPYNISAMEFAPIGPSAITISVLYENWDVVQGTAEQTITIPIHQQTELELEVQEAPDVQVKNGEAIAGVDLKVRNLGNAKVLNVNVQAEDGISMRESAFCSEILSGGEYRFDVQLNCEKSGVYTGTLLVSCKDYNGKVHQEKLQIELDVPETAAPAETQQTPEEETQTPESPEETANTGMDLGRVIGLGAMGVGGLGILGIGGLTALRKYKGRF